MIKTKYWLSILAISVVLIAGSLAVSPIAIADDDDDDDDDNEIVITGSAINNHILVAENTIQCRPVGSCTVTGPVTGPNPVLFGIRDEWKINPGAGDGVDTEYKINGNGATGNIIIADGTLSDNDKYEIENVADVAIFDGAGDDEYKVKGSTGDSVQYTDDSGDDELEFEG